MNSFYAPTPPTLFLNGSAVGQVTKNPYLRGRIDTDVFLHLLETNIDGLLSGKIPEQIRPTNARAYVKAADGTFLGSLEHSSLTDDSVFNKFGPYGSQFSPTSIFNQFGDYGGQFSDLSPYNIFTSTPPVIVVDDTEVAFLTKNKLIDGQLVDPDDIRNWLIRNGL